ncbi:MAG: transporter substrate-binding protein [Enterovirga sp.]|nr:transporter substrate-binding protein [Enterovirga sp.]
MIIRTSVAALLMSGAASLLALPALAQGTIKIGVNQPLTGPVAASGQYVTNGARIAADQINAAGGILGSKIELVIEDNKSNPTEAAAAAEKLIVRDKVPVMLGAWSSTFTLAVMPKLMEYEVPMVVETSSSGKITESGNPWIFRIAPTTSMETKDFAKKIDKFAIKRANFLVVNNDFGIDAATKFSELVKSHGGTVGVVERMDPTAQDVSAQLAKIKASDADTLFITTSVEQLTLVLRQAQALRLTQRIITTGGSQAPDQLIEHAGPAAEGSYHLVFFTPWFPENAPNADVAVGLVNEWKKRGYQFAGLTEGFRGYDGILTIAAAIKEAGKAEPKAIQQAFWKVKVKGANGDIAFEKSGPAGKESGQNVPNVYVIQIKDGKVTLPAF